MDIFSKTLPEPIPASQTLYPLLETMLKSLEQPMLPRYTCKDVAELFGVSPRTIQSNVADGTIPSRKLMGGARFLPADLEEYLRNARKAPAQ